MPWMRCSPAGPPDSTALFSGSTATMRTSGRLRAQHLAHAGDRAAGADAVHERVGRAVAELRQDLGAGRAPVGLEVGRVLELLRHERDRVVARDLDRLLDRAPHDLRRGRQVQLGAVRLQQRAPLERHVVGHRQDQAVALGRRHQRQADAGVAGGRLDDHRLAAA